MAVAMILNRGLFLPWLVSRVMHFGYFWFMNSIYTPAVLTAVPVYALALWLGRTILPGTRWLDLIAVGAIVSVAYYALAFLFCLPHRASRYYERLDCPQARPLIPMLSTAFAVAVNSCSPRCCGLLPQASFYSPPPTC